MYYFFLTRVGSVASEYRLKLMLAQSALTFQPRDAFFVRVTTPIGPDGAEAADRRAAKFLSESMALLSRGLPF
jgi:EpsI family protein